MSTRGDAADKRRVRGSAPGVTPRAVDGGLTVTTTSATFASPTLSASDELPRRLRSVSFAFVRAQRRTHHRHSSSVGTVSADDGAPRARPCVAGRTRIPAIAVRAAPSGRCESGGARGGATQAGETRPPWIRYRASPGQGTCGPCGAGPRGMPRPRRNTFGSQYMGGPLAGNHAPPGGPRVRAPRRDRGVRGGAVRADHGGARAADRRHVRGAAVGAVPWAGGPSSRARRRAADGAPRSADRRAARGRRASVCRCGREPALGPGTGTRHARPRPRPGVSAPRLAPTGRTRT
jgi:hypothetical protein